MRKICTILILVIFIKTISLAQVVNYVEIGQTALITAGNTTHERTYDVRKKITTHYGIIVVDSVFHAPIGTSISTINAVTRVTGQELAIAIQRGWSGAGTIIAADDSISYCAYGTGTNPIIDGADVINGITDEGSNIWQKTGITVQPYIMYLNDTIGELKDNVAACTSAGAWYWDSGTNVFSVYSESDPNGSVELGQRGILIDASSRNNITIQNLTFQHSNNINTTGSNARGAVYMYQGSYLTVSGCTFKDNSRNGLHVIDSPHLTVDNNTFLRNGYDTDIGNNFVFTAFTPGMTDITFSNNICSYAGHNGCQINAGTIANRITDVDIHGNTFDYNKAAGAYTIKCDSVTVYNNTFDNNGDATATGEDYAYGSQGCNSVDFYNNTVTNQRHNDAVQFWSDASESANNIRVFRNRIDGVTDGDCIGINTYDNLTSENIEIFSNVLINADYRGISLYRSGAGIASTPSIYNNTFYGNLVGDISTMVNFPVIIKNNIFGSDAIGVIASALTSGIETSNNLYYRASGSATVLSYNGSSYSMATITNFEASAQNTDPLFTDAANEDFTLQTSSPAINNGTDVGLTEDILGNPIVGLPDIGAYEKQ